MRKRGLPSPLRRPVFRRLAATYAVNELGDWMGLIALSVLVYDQTGDVIATTALFMGTGFVPALLAPLLVTRAELSPPRFALPVIYCGEAAAFGVLTLLVNDFSLAAVVALAAIDGVLAIASRSLTRAVVASTLEPGEELRAGNAILNIAFTGGAAAGPALAGAIVASFGVQTALLLDAVSFCVIAWILLTAGALPQADPEPGRMRERLRAGIAYVREKALLRRLLVAQGVAFVFFSTVLPVEVIYAKETLGAGDAGYGLMLGSWGVGMVLGGFIFASLPRAPLPRLLFFSTLAIGVGYLCIALASTLALACAASVVGGAGNGVLWVSTISAVQELTVAGMQARVMSILESLSTAMPGIGFALGGAIAALSSPRVTFLVAALGVFAILALEVPVFRSNWPERTATSQSNELDGGGDIMLELIAGSSAVQSYSEVKP
jgi:MFS family permease